MESSNSVTRQSFSKPMARRGKGKQIYQVGLVGLDFYLLSSPTRLFISQATKGERQEQQAVVQEISSSDSSYKHTRSYILYNVSVSWTCAKKKKKIQITAQPNEIIRIPRALSPKNILNCHFHSYIFRIRRTGSSLSWKFRFKHMI